jgi:hypothetical protein
MVPVDEIGLGGRPVRIGRGRWGGSAQNLRWRIEGRRWFERSGLNHSNLFEAGLLQGRSHGLLLLLRWVIFGSLSFLGLPVIHYELRFVVKKDETKTIKYDVRSSRILE